VGRKRRLDDQNNTLELLAKRSISRAALFYARDFSRKLLETTSQHI
jgi:hypothetical protein